jgi:hypothetical protein
MTAWNIQPAPMDIVSELRAAARLYNCATFSTAADELEGLRTMADRFRQTSPEEYGGFLADYAIRHRVQI